MEEVQLLKLSIDQIKQLVFDYYNINQIASFNTINKPFEEFDLSFKITEKKKVGMFETEQLYIINQEDINNIIEKMLNQEGLTISNYYYNKLGNHDLKLITFSLKKLQKIKQKSIGGNKNV